jgi:hypothetical protein
VVVGGVEVVVVEGVVVVVGVVVEVITMDGIHVQIQ